MIDGLPWYLNLVLGMIIGIYIGNKDMRKKTNEWIAKFLSKKNQPPPQTPQS